MYGTQRRTSKTYCAPRLPLTTYDGSAPCDTAGPQVQVHGVELILRLCDEVEGVGDAVGVVRSEGRAQAGRAQVVHLQEREAPI